MIPAGEAVDRELRQGERWQLLQFDRSMAASDGIPLAIRLRRQGFGVALLESGILVDTQAVVDA